MNNHEAEYELLIGMKPEERKLFLEEIALTDEELLLQYMIEQNVKDDRTSKGFARYAKEWIDPLHTDIEKAEGYTELAENMRKQMYTIGEIREQRKRVQWQRTKVNKLKMLKEQNNEPSKSSSD